MNEIAAKELESKLKNKYLGDCVVSTLLDYGASAAIFKGLNKNNNVVVIKVYDTNINDYQDITHIKKILSFEEKFIKEIIPCLIQIIQTGIECIDNQKYYYVLMDFIEGENLKKFALKGEIDHLFIQNTIQKLVTVTEILLENKIVHRDIKPENIIVKSGGEIVLIDLGSLEDEKWEYYLKSERDKLRGNYFLPDYLISDEHYTIVWRKINYYQIMLIYQFLLINKRTKSLQDFFEYLNFLHCNRKYMSTFNKIVFLNTRFIVQDICTFLKRIIF